MIRTVVRDTRGASAAEFGLVLPLLVLLIFGVIDAGRLMWEYNQAEKATQVGARLAVVTNILEPGLASEGYVNKIVNGVPLTQGDIIPIGALGTITCTSGGCTCTAGPCPTPGTFVAADFTRLVQRMATIKPDIVAANVQVTYQGSGLGFAGDPNGMEIAPLVTVRLGDEANPDSSTTPRLRFRPITFLALTTFKLPTFSSSLTAEDASGTASN